MLPINGRSKTLLLFFAVYLLFSVVLVSLDQHAITFSKTCSLCFLKKTLCSSINPLPVLNQINLAKLDILLIDELIRFFDLILFYPGNTYRGPPLIFR